MNKRDPAQRGSEPLAVQMSFRQEQQVEALPFNASWIAPFIAKAASYAPVVSVSAVRAVTKW
jgi:hypothetical protein